MLENLRATVAEAEADNPEYQEAASSFLDLCNIFSTSTAVISARSANAALRIAHSNALQPKEPTGGTGAPTKNVMERIPKCQLVLDKCREHHETARKVRQGLAQVFKWVRANVVFTLDR